LTATAQRKFQNGFEPLPSGFTYANFNDLQDVKEKVSDRTCAIMVEPIQGESGVWPANQSFLSGLRDLCDKKKVLLIFDEVQTGFGRTGKLFSYEHHGIMPDVMTLAKALGGGMAIGAMVARSEFSDLLDQGSHASTFGGNPLACAVAKVSLETILNDGLCERSRKMGAFLIEKLSGLREKHDLIEEIRGKGLMIGVDLKYGRASEIVELCTKKGLLINATSENTLRFLPPLTITRDEINHAVSILDDVFSRL
jgi:acetylornithine/succinyldiaminopimelate/putrescine aminotransferase